MRTNSEEIRSRRRKSFNKRFFCKFSLKFLSHFLDFFGYISASKLWTESTKTLNWSSGSVQWKFIVVVQVQDNTVLDIMDIPTSVSEWSELFGKKAITVKIYKKTISKFFAFSAYAYRHSRHYITSICDNLSCEKFSLTSSENFSTTTIFQPLSRRARNLAAVLLGWKTSWRRSALWFCSTTGKILGSGLISILLAAPISYLPAN